MAFNVNEGGEDAPMSDINVTPLVDVMLVLLIVFMIACFNALHSNQFAHYEQQQRRAEAGCEAD